MHLLLHVGSVILERRQKASVPKADGAPRMLLQFLLVLNEASLAYQPSTKPLNKRNVLLTSNDMNLIVAALDDQSTSV